MRLAHLRRIGTEREFRRPAVEGEGRPAAIRSVPRHAGQRDDQPRRAAHDQGVRFEDGLADPGVPVEPPRALRFVAHLAPLPRRRRRSRSPRLVRGRLYIPGGGRFDASRCDLSKPPLSPFRPMGCSRRTRVPRGPRSTVFDFGTTAFRNWSAGGALHSGASGKRSIISSLRFVSGVAHGWLEARTARGLVSLPRRQDKGIIMVDIARPESVKRKKKVRRVI